MQDFESYLQLEGLSVTDSRKSLFALLSAADRPMEIDDIKAQLPTVDRATVYRMIETFEQHKIIERVWFGDEVLIKLTARFGGTEYHLVCEKCGRIEKIKVRSADRQLNRRARKHGFTPTRNIIQSLGICPDCQAKLYSEE